MLGFALVGCGRIARKHAGNLGEGKIPGAKLVAVCDIKEDRAKFYGEKYDVPWYTDMHKMMETENENIDVLDILTPSGDHANNTVELAPYGKHIIVEKPMALTLQDADRMIAACDKAGIKLFVVKQNRLNTPVKKLREALEADRFGKMVLGTVRVRWCRDQAYYDQDEWRGTWEHDGGCFANQAIHHVDLLQWMMGPVESVFAKSATRLVNIEAEDTGVVILKFTSGALGVIEATTATRPKDLEGSISILGETGTVEIGGFAVNEMKTWNFLDESETDKEEVLSKYKQNPPDVYGFGHTEYLSNVVETITGKKEALVDGLAGRKSLELIAAIYESIETGKEVNVNFVPQKCRLGLK
ncbi:Gfo/Idh/MocA family protein [Halobacteriovorax sp. ZH5_bin.2]|uniref:Gfo/Idh/MocA family protein n=1 Tax=Halobacteriovorax sp. ZH5_bin.2 TaxID=3157727 RepID=UPI00371D4CC8